MKTNVSVVVPPDGDGADVTAVDPNVAVASVPYTWLLTARPT